MDAERWEQIQRVYLEAEDHPPGARERFLDRSCAGDPELRAEVESLLRAGAAAGGLLDATLDELVLLIEDDAPPPSGHGTPDSAGPYRIVEEIGRGGMGAVYRAERDDDVFDRSVALKVVRLDLAAPGTIRRFRREQRILAGLEHPSIARLYDAGVTGDGRPWLAMELVDGEPIHRYCDRLRLTVAERLALFEQVADAVDHAHRSLVIHRDLKPSNILVTDGGRVKLLDFGIAKLLEPPGDVDDDGEEDPLTRVDQRLLTPEYASPEQIRGEPLTTAADVYALGVLLHELLTGVRPAVDPATREVTTTPSTAVSRAAPARTGPGGGSGRSEADGDAHAVARHRSTTPARLRRTLRGELDLVVLEALRPEPERRYPSAAALRDDLVRYRRGHPVRARPPSLRYRFTKFVRRNRIPVLAAAAVVVSLLAGLGAALQQTRVARQERDTARAVSGFLESLFTASSPFGAPEERLDTLRIRAFLERAVERLDDDLAGQPEVRARMQAILGSVHENLGIYEPARELLEASLQAYRTLEGEDSPEVAARTTELARLTHAAGDPVEAEALYDDALARNRAAHGDDSPEVATVRAERAGVLLTLDRLDEAAADLEAAVEIRRTAADGPTQELADLLNRLGALEYRRGRIDLAIRSMRESLDMFRQVVGREHPNTVILTQNLGFLLLRQERADEAEPLLRDALAGLSAAFGPDYPRIGPTLGTLAAAVEARGRWTEADSLHRASLAHIERVQGEVNLDRAAALSDYGMGLMAQGDLGRADSVLTEAIRVQDAVTGPESVGSAVVRSQLGAVARRRGRPGVAESRYRAALDVLDEAFPPGHPRRLDVRIGLGRALADQGRTEEAAAVLTAAWEAAQEADGWRSFARGAAQALADLYADTDAEAADLWRRRADEAGG